MKQKQLNSAGLAHYILPLIIVVGVAITGVYLIVASHANPVPKSPFAHTTFNDKHLCINDSYVSSTNVYHKGVVPNGHTYTYSGKLSITYTQYISGPYTSSPIHYISSSAKHTGRCDGSGHDTKRYQNKIIKSPDKNYSNVGGQG